MVVLALYHRCAAPCSLIDLIILTFEMKCWERCGRWPFCNILLFKWSPVLPTMDKQWVGLTRSNACQTIVKLIVSSVCVSSLNTSQCCITNIRSLKWTKESFLTHLISISWLRYLLFNFSASFWCNESRWIRWKRMSSKTVSPFPDRSSRGESPHRR